LWEMEPPDADGYFAVVLRDAAKGTRLSRAQALKTYFLFLELRHKVDPPDDRLMADVGLRVKRGLPVASSARTTIGQARGKVAW
jgi:hypothetical protein